MASAFNCLLSGQKSLLQLHDSYNRRFQQRIREIFFVLKLHFFILGAPQVQPVQTCTGSR